MKSFIKPVVFTVAALSAASFIAGSVLFGPKETIQRAKALITGIRQTVDESASTSHLITLAKGQLAGAEIRLQEAATTVKLFRNRADKVQGDMGTLSDCVKVTHSRLELLQPVLKGETKSFVLNGVNHSRSEVEADARRLLTVLEGHQNQLKLKTVEHEELRKAIASSENELGAARVEFDGARGRLAELELKISTEEAKAQVASAATNSRDSLAAELNGGFSRAMGELEKRLAGLQTANNRTAGAMAHSSGTIAWGAEPVSLVDAVDNALGTRKVSSTPESQVTPGVAKPEAAKPSADAKPVEAPKATPSATPVTPANAEPAKPAVTSTKTLPDRFANVPAASLGNRILVSSCGRN